MGAVSYASNIDIIMRKLAGASANRPACGHAGARPGAAKELAFAADARLVGRGSAEPKVHAHRDYPPGLRQGHPLRRPRHHERAPSLFRFHTDTVEREPARRGEDAGRARTGGHSRARRRE